MIILVYFNYKEGKNFYFDKGVKRTVQEIIWICFVLIFFLWNMISGRIWYTYLIFGGKLLRPLTLIIYTEKRNT